jgi:hypothetical protein
MTSDGDVVATWRESEAGGTPASLRSRIGVWPAAGAATAETVDDDDYPSAITTDASGGAILWHDRAFSNDFHWRERSPGGSFGPSQTYALPGSDDPPGMNHATNGNGDIALVWRQGTKLLAAIRPAGGDFGPAQELADVDGDFTYPRPLLTDAGELVVVWSNYTQETSTQLRALHRSPSGEVSEAQTLATGTGGVAIDLVADDAGDAVLVWHERGETADELRYRVAMRPAGGAFSEYPLPVSPQRRPRIAITDGGVVTLAAAPHRDFPSVRIFSGRVGGELSLLQTLRWNPEGLVTGGEQTMVVATPDAFHSVSSTRTGDGPFGPAEDLRSDCGAAILQDLAMNDDGRRMAVWLDGLNSHTMWLSRGEGASGTQSCLPADNYLPDAPVPNTNPPPDGPAASGGTWQPGPETYGLPPQPETALAALRVVAPPTITGRRTHRRIALSVSCGEFCYAFGSALVIGPHGRAIQKKLFLGDDHADDGNLSLDWALDLDAKARRRLANGTRAFKVRLHMRFGDRWSRLVPRTYVLETKAAKSRSRRSRR